MGKTTTQKTENMPPEWSRSLFSNSADQAQSIYDSGKGGNVYQGQTVADLSNGTQNGINTVQSAASSLPTTSSAQNYLTNYANGSTLQEGNPYYRDRLMSAIGDSNALVQSQFAGSGRYGSGANTDALAKNTNNMLLSGLESDYNRAQQNQFNAVNAIDSNNNALASTRAATGQAAIQAGQVQDQNQQQKLTADFTKWQSEDMQPWTRLGLMQSAAAGSAGNYGTNTQTQTQPFNAMQGIGALGQLFAKSDARLKTDIEPVGRKNGLTIYEWRYRGDVMRYRGVMAQDVIEIAPQAVYVANDGMMAVSYSALGLEMEAA